MTGVTDIARRDPELVAIDMLDHQMTYRMLDTAADALARRLVMETDQASAVGNPGPQVCVPMVIEGTESLAVAAEAVQRAGMVAVPVDPTSPVLRRNHIATEVAAPFVLTDLDEDLGRRMLHPLLDGITNGDPVRRPPGRLGSILFTSGSTGYPKGVMRSPSNVDSLTEIIASLSPDGPARIGITSAGSLGAAYGMHERLAAAGCTLVPFEIRRPSRPLVDWIREARPYFLAAVPTLLRQLLVALGETEVLTGVKVIGLFGETTTWEDVETVRRHMEPDGIVVNAFGQSEAGVVAVMIVGPDTPIGSGRLPVGYPVEGVDVKIVDGDGVELPAGSEGEIRVRSKDAAFGYWNDQPETERVFASQPDGSTVVRTGDIGRMGLDGTLEHLGRRDHMVKVSGANRVDLGEVESWLRRYHHVADAVATTYQDSRGDLRLRAFVVMEPSWLLNGRVARGWLRQRLPRPAVPDVVEQLAELPRLANGKVDRVALARTPLRAQSAEGNAVEPEAEQSKTPVDPAILAKVTEIWQQTLGLDDIGVDEDFFDLGGDSLRAVNLVVDISAAFGTELPLWLLLEESTPRAMSAAVTGKRDDRPIITLQARGDGTPLYVVHDHYGNLFGARNFLSAMALDQPIYGFRPTSWDAHPVLERSLEALCHRYVDVVCRQHPTGAVSLCGQASGGVIAFEVARQLRDRGRTVTVLMVDASFAPAETARMATARRLGELAAIPRSQLTSETVRLAADGTRFALGAARRWVPTRRQQALGEMVPNSERPQEVVDRARGYYASLLRRYRPGGTYSGSVVVGTASFIPAENDHRDRWRQWVSGPIRMVDLDTAATELETGPRVLDRLAP